MATRPTGRKANGDDPGKPRAGGQLKRRYKDIGAKREARQRALKIKGGRNLLVILAVVYFLFGCLLFTLIGALLEGVPPGENTVTLTAAEVERLEQQYVSGSETPDPAAFDRACAELLEQKRQAALADRSLLDDHPELVPAAFYWGQALAFLVLFFYAAKQPLQALRIGLAIYLLAQTAYLLTLPYAFRGAGGWLIRIAIVYVFVRAIRAHKENARMKAQAEFKKELRRARSEPEASPEETD